MYPFHDINLGKHVFLTNTLTLPATVNLLLNPQKRNQKISDCMPVLVGLTTINSLNSRFYSFDFDHMVLTQMFVFISVNLHYAECTALPLYICCTFHSLLLHVLFLFLTSVFCGKIWMKMNMHCNL